MNQEVQKILEKLKYCIETNTYEAVETHKFELKPSMPGIKDATAKSIYQSVNAFLNTQGGFIIIGVEDANNKIPKEYIFKGYREDYETPIKSIIEKFTDKNGIVQDVQDYLQYEIVDFLNGRLCVIYVNELIADKKYLFFQGKAFTRIVTGDHEISQQKIQSWEEYKTEIKDRRELLPVPQAAFKDIDINKINDYIIRLNAKNHIENLKSDINSAMSFLLRQKFVINENEITTLGMLVVGQAPENFLGFKAKVRCFLHTKIKPADDKAEFSGTVLDLMQKSLAFVLKSIQVGVSRDDSGKDVAEYPETLLSESINNALAHRDYKLDDYVGIIVRPNEHIEISNPGTFRQQLLVEELTDVVSFRRIIPSSKPINVNLAQVLSVFSKWEGLGNGMTNLVQAALNNETDLPYYKFDVSEKISLFINKGKLLDNSMELLFEIYEGYINRKLNGNPFDTPMKEAFSYLYKSELQNQKGHYTILLTSDNNHSDAIQNLKKAELIMRHPKSPNYVDVYVVDRTFLQQQFGKELLSIFGASYENLSTDYKKLLQLIYQYNTYSKTQKITASKAGNILWFRENKWIHSQKAYDAFKRKIRTQFNNLEQKKYLLREGQSVHTSYKLNLEFKQDLMLF